MELLHINCKHLTYAPATKNKIMGLEYLQGATVVALRGESVFSNDLSEEYNIVYLCYYQNRLFNLIATKYSDVSFLDENTGEYVDIEGDTIYQVGDVIVDYCVIPEADSLLGCTLK